MIKSTIIFVSILIQSCSTVFTIENDCLEVFIRSIFSREAFRKEAQMVYVLFENPKDARYFTTKKVRYNGRTICLKKAKPPIGKDVLIIHSIKQSEPNRIWINFTTTYSGTTFEGTVFLGVKDRKAYFLDASIVRINI